MRISLTLVSFTSLIQLKQAKVKAFLALLLFFTGLPALQAATVPGLAGEVDLVAGEKYFSGACAACHGSDGNSSIAQNPKLAGQHPAYLVKQLKEFKSGARNSPIMQAFVSSMDDATMRNIAAWLSEQKPKPGTAKNEATVDLGEQIYRGGIADRQIPACAGCHSPNGAGIPARYPRLAGQQSVYVAEQLKAFRSGTRTNGPVMADIAAKMSDLEIEAVSDYIAGLR